MCSCASSYRRFSAASRSFRISSRYGRSSPPGGSAADVDPDRLDVRVLLERMDRLVAPEPRLLEAAERRGDVAVVEAVDPDDAGAQGSCEPMRTRHIACPDGGREAVHGVVRDADCLVLVDERDRGKHRAED